MDTKFWYIKRIWFRKGEPCIWSLYDESTHDGPVRILAQHSLLGKGTTKWTGDEIGIMLSRIAEDHV